MKQREDEIECQRGIKIVRGEMIGRPRGEQDECGKSRKRIKNKQPGFEQREREHAKIDNKQIGEQKRRPMRDRWERQQIKHRDYRDRGESQRAAEKFTARFPSALRPRHRREKQRLKSGKDCHDNKDFVSSEIFFGNKERRHPGELHKRSSNRAESRERTPPFSLSNPEETDVEQRDIAEESERMILTR